MGSLGVAAALALGASAVSAQSANDLRGYGQTLGSPQQERELDGGTGAGTGNALLDATNPIDLMNKLRRATALEDATSPRDAVDAALSDFQAQPQPASPGSTGVKAP
jgi:hypothetical protein